MGRRIILAILGILFLGLVLGCCLQYRSGQRKQPCTKQLFAMDTFMSFTAYGKNSEEAVDAAMAEVQRLDALLSTGNADSEVSQVNASGGGSLSKDSSTILEEAMKIYELTDGLFDFTIYPLMELWGFPSGDYHVPAKEELLQVLPLVDASKIQYAQSADDTGSYGKSADGKSTGDKGSYGKGSHGESLYGKSSVLLGEGQKIDFGGIAKGYASARVMEIFREYGISSGMVSLGGNVHVLNRKPDHSKWKIGIQDPDSGQGEVLAVLSVENKAVITSGGYERYFEEDGERYIHILDPRTGYPANQDLVSVTIVSENGTLADALSTSLYIMGLEEAIAYWKAQGEEFDMALITEDGKIYVTEGISKEFQTDGEVIVLHPSGL